MRRYNTSAIASAHSSRRNLSSAGEVEDLAAEHQSAVDQVSETETWKDKEQRIVTTFPLVSFNHNSDID